MNANTNDVTVTLRIPGRWAHPRELVQALPPGCRATPEKFVLPDGSEFEIDFREADDQFPQIFRQSLRQPASKAELEIVDNYTVNVILSGPGGSMAAAHAMMKAGAAIVQAGAAGVFNDNSTLAHAGEHWRMMAEDGDSDALSFAFAAIIRGKSEAWTMGMHVLGLRDVVMKRYDIESEGFDIVEVIRYLARGEHAIDDGHIIADEEGPRFKAFHEPAPADMAGSPMHNPFGWLKLVSLRDIAEIN